jgi:DNA polymerase sigma
MVVSSVDPKLAIAVYGSMATSVALDVSDLDLAICTARTELRKDIFACIQQLSAALEQLDSVQACQTIATAKVPIIKLVS